QWIVRCAMLDSAGLLEPYLIEARIDQLAEPLRGYECENGNGDGIWMRPGNAHQESRASVRVLSVKPGPSAISIDCGGNPAAIARSRTKSAVGADMFPKRARMARS